MKKNILNDGFYTFDKRIKFLKRLNNAILNNQQELLEGIYNDTNKNEIESLTSEIFTVLKDINYFINNIQKISIKKSFIWSIPNSFSKLKTKFEPYGICLIISPYNFPFSLAFKPLVAAIAAGNKVVLKISERSENTYKISKKIIEEAFSEDDILVLEHNLNINELNKIYSYSIDFVFFTGSQKVGNLIYQEAAKYNLPVILELGGANPVIVLDDADFRWLAKRLIWAKLWNGSQVCISPNHLYLPKNKLNDFIILLKNEISIQLNDLTKQQLAFTNLNRKEFSTNNLLVKEKLSENQDLVIFTVDNNSIHVTNENFSTFIPIVTYDNNDDLLEKVKIIKDPLTMYFFSKNKNNPLIENITSRSRSGSVSINEFIYFINIKNFAFGGIGSSGIGRYVDYYSLAAFSYIRPYFYKNTKFDLKLLYHPFDNKKTKFIKKFTNFQIYKKI